MSSFDSDVITDFLSGTGWEQAERKPLKGDASSRRYARLEHGADTAILMWADPAHETPACPPDASEAERLSLGYNAQVRLAGPHLEAFAALSLNFTRRGFSAPRIYKADLDQGFLLLEHLGDDLFARHLERVPEDEPVLYEAAVDLLAALYRSTFDDIICFEGRDWPLLDFDFTTFLGEADRIWEWYFIWRMKLDLSEGARAEWVKIWRDLYDRLSHIPPGLVLRDYHAENLFWLPEREHEARVGLIDYQDALMAHPAYDLISLLEDARRDVPRDLADKLIPHFCYEAGLACDEYFRHACLVWSAQRNIKILGQVIMWTQAQGRASYLPLWDRVYGHFMRTLDAPLMTPLKSWLTANAPQLLEGQV